MATFSDNFDRADNASLGGNWTEASGSLSINTNQLYCDSAGYTRDVAVYTGTATAGVNQYVKVTKTVEYGLIWLRYTDATSPYYELYLRTSEDTLTWLHFTAVGGTQTSVSAATAMTIVDGESVGVTIVGTGNDTVLRIWRNPTANAPDEGGETWDSAAATVTLTDNPASPVDTGSYVGIGAAASVAGNIFDDFYGGDIPTAGGTPIPVFAHYYSQQG